MPRRPAPRSGSATAASGGESERVFARRGQAADHVDADATQITGCLARRLAAAPVLDRARPGASADRQARRRGRACLAGCRTGKRRPVARQPARGRRGWASEEDIPPRPPRSPAAVAASIAAEQEHQLAERRRPAAPAPPRLARGPRGRRRHPGRAPFQRRTRPHRPRQRQLPRIAVEAGRSAARTRPWPLAQRGRLGHRWTPRRPQPARVVRSPAAAGCWTRRRGAGGQPGPRTPATRGAGRGRDAGLWDVTSSGHPGRSAPRWSGPATARCTPPRQP